VNSPEKQTELARDIASVIPVETEFIARTVEGVVSARAITGIAAILGLLWAASAAFGAVRKGINAAWGIKKTRPFLRERLMDFTLVLGAGLLVMSLLLATPAITLAHDTIELLAPNTKVTLADVWIGALFASAAFEGANWGFVLYVKSVPIYGAVYGPIGAIMALLTWVYVSAIILLFGAHITSRYAAYAERVRDKQGLKLVWTGISRVRLRVVAST